MLSIILTGAALIREREHGTIEHLLVMPLTPFEIMMAKVWSMGLVVVVVATASLVFVVQGCSRCPSRARSRCSSLATALHLFATTSMGIFLGTVARSMPQLGLLMIIILLPLQMLSGGMHAAREHARIGAEHHAGGADHPFRLARPGHSLPRRRLQRSSGRSFSPCSPSAASFSRWR